jgi:hypothetical protein
MFLFLNRVYAGLLFYVYRYKIIKGCYESFLYKKIQGKTIEEAKYIFPKYRFQLQKYRGYHEVYYPQLVNVRIDTSCRIIGASIG